MLKTRMKRIADQNARAVQRLAEIEASVVGLADEDLLDLADIFLSGPKGPVSEIAIAEMAKRGISL